MAEPKSLNHLHQLTHSNPCNLHHKPNPPAIIQYQTSPHPSSFPINPKPISIPKTQTHAHDAIAATKKKKQKQKKEEKLMGSSEIKKKKKEIEVMR